MEEYLKIRNRIVKKLGFWKNPYKNPLYYWWKVRKIFKKPPLHIHIGKYTYIMLCDWIKPPKIQFACNGLGWKDKWNSPRFEYPPNILFKFFNWEIRLVWTWKWRAIDELYDDYTTSYIDDVYWETVLDVCEYHKSIYKAVKDNTWTNIQGKDSNVRTLNLLKNDEC